MGQFSLPQNFKCWVTVGRWKCQERQTGASYYTNKYRNIFLKALMNPLLAWISTLLFMVTSDIVFCLCIIHRHRIKKRAIRSLGEQKFRLRQPNPRVAGKFRRNSSTRRDKIWATGQCKGNSLSHGTTKIMKGN